MNTRRWSRIISILTVVLAVGFTLREIILAEQKAERQISFSRDIQPILTKNCAIPECHTGPKPAKGMVLDSGKAYGNLVKVKSKESPRQMRIAPGDLQKSYLYDKLTGNHKEGDRMPPKKRLPKESIELIRNWILAGAPNDSSVVAEDSSLVKDGKPSQQNQE